uniref:Uncharacterized protein n=1 Tax=Oryza punctata TaxID=4537 RepID=A0A0E0LM57_ORYPU
MRAADGKGCTDAYAVTISDCFDPAWNEQYKWPVYDSCTVLNIGVFDDPPPSSQLPDAAKDRVYPLIMMLPTGAERMGDVELAIRFATSASALDVLHMREPRGAAVVRARISVAHLARSEPPLWREVATWMLDAAEPRGFSMWKLSPTGTAPWRCCRGWPTRRLSCSSSVLLAWQPDLVQSMAEAADREELDNEFDSLPSSRPPAEATRAERLQALMSWREGREARI